MTVAKLNILNDKVTALEDKIKLYTIVAWAFVFFGIVPFVYGIGKLMIATPEKIDVVGQFLGGVTSSLWSLAGLFIIYVAFLGQKQQLILQQEELEATRSELRGQKEQLQAQNDTFRKQAFESTFFQMLSLHHRTRNEITFSGKAGVGVFEGYVENFLNYHYQAFDRDPALPEAERLQRAYESFYSSEQDTLGHYFRSLYNVIKFVDRADLPPSEKRFYSNLVRAQLSTWELIMLFYNGMSSYGEKFKPLIDRYGLLKHMDGKLLLRPTHEHYGYERSARGLL